MKHPEKIISMSEFVLWIRDNGEDIELNRITLLDLIVWYAELLQTPLSLEMFVAVKDGKVLELMLYEGKEIDKSILHTYSPNVKEQILKYQQARKKILFEGWKIHKKESDGIYIGDKFELAAFWNSEDAEFELKIAGGFNTIETIEEFIEFHPAITDKYWEQIFEK